jgi:hypothetical protein
MTVSDDAQQNDDLDLKDALRDGARRAYDTAAEETQRVSEFVREQASTMAERQKTTFARGVANFASHIRKSSEGFSEQPNIEDLISRTADRVESAAISFEEKSGSELYEDAERICRQYPVTIAACAVVLGALVSRSLKSPPRPVR